MRTPSNTYLPHYGVCKYLELQRFGEVIMRECINNPDGVELPFNIGLLRIEGRKGTIKHKPPWHENDLTMNPHTDGYAFRVALRLNHRKLRFFKSIKWATLLTFQAHKKYRTLIYKKIIQDPHFYHRY